MTNRENNTFMNIILKLSIGSNNNSVKRRTVECGEEKSTK